MKALAISLIALLPLTSGLPDISALDRRQGPAKSCTSLTAPTVPGATVVQFNATQTSSVCNVNVYLSHTGSNDRVRIQHYLPLTGWTGRYQGNGGGGMSAGSFDSALQSAASQGFVSGSTDAGLPNSSDGSSWAGNEQLLKNFAHLSVHEMTVVGKALAEQFYGSPVKYAYWNGCSTGGRQGYMEVQRYPEDYQGVYAYSPAINWDRFHVAMLYPYLVQKAANEFPTTCIWDAVTSLAIQACDSLDGGRDNLIVNPNQCLDFDTSTIVGRSVSCAGRQSNITAKQADMWKKITTGPLDKTGRKAWYGIAPGATFSGLGGNQPFFLAQSWTKNFVMRSTPNFDVGSIKPEDLAEVIAKSHEMFNDVIGTDNPDLSPFKKAGGKLLSWHGWADQLIFANGTVDYRLRVEEKMGGPEAVDEFYRLFMAPGVQHCSGGNGAAPSDPMSLLINWVEKGIAPDTLPAKGSGSMARNLCRFPKNLKYSGSGDVNTATSWTCA